MSEQKLTIILGAETEYEITIPFKPDNGDEIVFPVDDRYVLAKLSNVRYDMRVNSFTAFVSTLPYVG